MLRVGVIGLGWMGKVHIRVYSQMRNVKLIGFMDVDPAIRTNLHEQYGVPGFEDLDQFLDQDLDAVSVCVPTALHYETVMRVLERSIPCIVEKPLAATSEQGRELVATAHANGTQLMVGHVERFNPAVARAKDLAAKDKVISIQIERVGPYPPRIQDVGVIRDLASHDIDLITYITESRYKEIQSFTSSNIGEHEDTAMIMAEMQCGALAQINCNWVTPYKSRRIRIAGVKGYIEADLITQQVKEYSKFETYESSYSVREWPLIYREPVREELAAFLEAVREGKPTPITGEDGLYVLETIDRLGEFNCQGA